MDERYRSEIFGLRIDSPFPLPAAPRGPAGGACDVDIGWTGGIAPAARPGRDLLPGVPDIRRDPAGGIDILWAAEIHIQICPAGDRVRIVSRPEKLPFLPTVVVGMVIGLVLHQRGILALHGTALNRGGRTVAFLGPSGAGKSTIAAGLVARGARLLADDIVALRHQADGAFHVAPGPAGLRLTEASVKAIGAPADGGLPVVPWADKLLWHPDAAPGPAAEGAAAVGALPLDALYIVRPVAAAGDTAAHRIDDPAQATAALVENWYPPYARRLMTRDQFQRIGALSTAVPVHVLDYARRWQSLDAVAVELSA